MYIYYLICLLGRRLNIVGLKLYMTEGGGGGGTTFKPCAMISHWKLHQRKDEGGVYKTLQIQKRNKVTQVKIVETMFL